jgi:hypothetical protein
LQALKNNLSSENKRKRKISIFLFVENSFYGRIIVEINAGRSGGGEQLQTNVYCHNACT